jgi:formyltetrahydrofolate deformylase
MEQYILTISCPDKVGIVASVSTFLAQNGGFINESHQYGDVTTGNFFMRTLYTSEQDSLEEWKKKFQEIADNFSMKWKLQLASYRPRVLIMVSKEGHCLNGILNKHSMGNLSIEIPAIVSNHCELKKMAQSYDIPFYEFKVTPETKEEKENEILKLIDQLQIELVVLARYMQILSPNFVSELEGKIINIHHSFLPSFKGAKPYHQAFDHGVKLIGATAHYVTADLDEGPIIEQGVARVNHTFYPSELVALGQDIESVTLSNAVNWHTQLRVFINGKKTVVFS